MGNHQSMDVNTSDAPEYTFSLEQKETSMMVFSYWMPRNFKLIGNILYTDHDGTLHKLLCTTDSVSVKLFPSEADFKHFPFQTTCKNNSIYVFNSTTEEVREECITILNFSARSANWFYPFEELDFDELEVSLNSCHSSMSDFSRSHSSATDLSPRNMHPIAHTTPRSYEYQAPVVNHQQDVRTPQSAQQQSVTQHQSTVVQQTKIEPTQYKAQPPPTASSTTTTIASPRSASITQPSRQASITVPTAQRTNSVASITDRSSYSKLNGQSIIFTPPAEYLLKRAWINKRGHMLRTWKKRWCVLEKNELKYYEKADTNPPYGKGLKGQIALLGAVASVSLTGGTKPSDPLILCVEIFGDQGEKDLFFELEFNEDAQEWVRVLQWAIRKATISSLVHNLMRKASSDDDDDKRPSCEDWLFNERKLFTTAIQSLMITTATVQVLQYKKTGERVTDTCSLWLWTGHKEGPSGTSTYIPDDKTPSSCIGVAWQSKASKSIRTIAFSDLEDVVVYDHNDKVNTTQSMQLSGSIVAVSTGAKSNAITDGYNNPNYHRNCLGRRTKVVSFVTKYGHSLDILACCLHDHGGSILAIRDIILYQGLKVKLNSGVRDIATTRMDSGIAVCGACVSVRHKPCTE